MTTIVTTQSNGIITYNLQSQQFFSLRYYLVKAGLLQRHEKFKSNQYSDEDLRLLDIVFNHFRTSRPNYREACRKTVIEVFGEDSLEYQNLLASFRDTDREALSKTRRESYG